MLKTDRKNAKKVKGREGREEGEVVIKAEMEEEEKDGDGDGKIN